MAASATRADDVATVDMAIAAAAPPVVPVGWSYGGGVIGDVTHDLDPDVVAHLHEHRCRPIALEAMLALPVAEAWRTVPTTVLLGRTDDAVGPEMRSWTMSHLDDVRLVDSDHFILWRQPEVIADVVLELVAG